MISSPLSLSATTAAAVVLLALGSSIFNPYFLYQPWLHSGEAADLVVMNGTIYTSDASFPYADSMAIRGGRILRVGSYSSVQDLVGSKTRMENLMGKVVVPGFIDSHVHLIFGGLQDGLNYTKEMELNITNMFYAREFGKNDDGFELEIETDGSNSTPWCEPKRPLCEQGQRGSIKPPGAWLLGGGWNNDLWGGDLPMASWIDDITPQNPVWLSRMDGHMGLANALALKLAGISNNTVNPEGGVVMRNSVGEPTGLLIDSAMKLVFSCIPEVSVEERREALSRASDHALSRGVTAVVDLGRYFPGASPELSWEDFSDVYRWADLSGKMKIRVCLFFPMETWARLHELIIQAGRKLSEWIYLGGVKYFADGSLGSSSALFYEPYVEEPLNHGLQVADIDELYNLTLASDKAGLQVSIHAIGDRANDMILDLYKSVATENGIRDRRFRIEHAQHLAPGTSDRFGKQEVVASVQPDHLLDDADSAIKKLGVERANGGSYLFNSLLAGNAQLVLGSDWPVADINPLRSMKSAIRRVPPGREKAWIPSECINLKDALNGYTISGARACFLDEDIGSLSPGKMADFVVLSVDSWDEFAARVSASVEATYVGGLRAYATDHKED